VLVLATRRDTLRPKRREPPGIAVHELVVQEAGRAKLRREGEAHARGELLPGTDRQAAGFAGPSGHIRLGGHGTNRETRAW
jgi:hypothetical protein